MLNLVNKEMLINIIKYYSLTKIDETPNSDKIIRLYSFDRYLIDVDKNLQIWAKNKKDIFKLFNNQLKIEIPLDNVTYGEESARNLLEEFLKKNSKQFSLPIIIFLRNILIEDIINNKLSDDVEIFNVYLKKDWKISKCFKLLEFNSEKLKQQQILYSQFLQQLQIKGKLVLSIDPIDYVTMSCNRSGWTSCHHPNNGYGTGGLGYMNDNSTILAYVTTDNLCKFSIEDVDTKNITNICFNDKIWRQVININPNFNYAIQCRQYPNVSLMYKEKVSELLIDLFKKINNSYNYNIIEKEVSASIFGILQEINKNLKQPNFYNDIEHESFDEARVILIDKYENDLSNLKKSLIHKHEEPIIVGEKVYCMCGCDSVNYTNYFLREDSDQDDCNEEYDQDDIMDEPIPYNNEDLVFIDVD